MCEPCSFAPGGVHRRLALLSRLPGSAAAPQACFSRAHPVSPQVFLESALVIQELSLGSKITKELVSSVRKKAHECFAKAAFGK